MRKFLITFICITAFMILGASGAAADSMLLEYDGAVHEYDGEVYALVVNNHEINPPLSPIIFNDRALVPVREIFEEVGATVEYNGDDQSIRIYNDDTTVLMFINDNIAYINGQKTAIPDNVVPKLISKLGGETKTMVPVRFISENIGMPVDFDSELGAILISSENEEYELPTAKSTVTDVSYDVNEAGWITMKVKTDSAVEHIDNFTMSSPGRLVVDFLGSSLGLGEEEIPVNAAGVTAIRLGDNGERARMVIDSEYISSYYLDMVSATEVDVVVQTDVPAAAPALPAQIVPSAAQEVAVQAAVPAYNRAANETKLVILDAGHGGEDSGAVGTLNGQTVLEKDLTLALTYKVKALLEANGVTVSLTRTGDTLPSLVERPTQANGENAALFVSIHINSADPASAHGIETYYATENNGGTYGISSSQLATSLLRHMLAETGAADRGVKIAEHAVTRRCNMPASLVECGFISNPEEVALMSGEDYQNKLAKGIADGILEMLPKVTIPG